MGETHMIEYFLHTGFNSSVEASKSKLINAKERVFCLQSNTYKEIKEISNKIASWKWFPWAVFEICAPFSYLLGDSIN